MVLSSSFTDAERSSVIAGYDSWKGTQAAYAASVGIAHGPVPSTDSRPGLRLI